MSNRQLTRDLISLRTACEELGVSDRTIRRYIATGQLTGYRVGARLLKVDRNEFDNLVRVVPAAGA